MSHPKLPPSEDGTLKREFHSYVIGLASALILTALAFAIVAGHMLHGRELLLTLGGLAAMQIAVHFRYFLHIDLKISHRDDLQLILFTTLIVAMMVGGSIWILWNQYGRMM